MPHTHLVRRKLTAMKRKKRNERWLMAKTQGKTIFYLADFDDENNTAMWCRDITDGMSFRTEHGVLQYLSTYLNSRSDVRLVCTAV